MKEPHYGYPCVENPHDFTPDYESCSDAEIAFWEDSKKRWDAGERDVRGARSASIKDPCSGNLVCHITGTSWGIGTSMIGEDGPDEMEQE